MQLEVVGVRVVEDPDVEEVVDGVVWEIVDEEVFDVVVELVDETVFQVGLGLW